MEAVRESTDLETLARDPGPHPGARAGHMAAGLVGSEILKIAADIRARAAARPAGLQPHGRRLRPAASSRSRSAWSGRCARRSPRGETNYPPSNGMPELRQAVRASTRASSASTTRSSRSSSPAARGRCIYCVYRTVVDPGDRVVYPVPSWNNNHYVHMVGGVGVPVPCARPRRASCPRREALAAALPGRPPGLPQLAAQPDRHGDRARRRSRGICEAILEENEAPRAARRAAALPACTTTSTGCSPSATARARHAARARPGDGALHDLRRRHQQGLRGDRRARRLGRRAGRRHRAHVGDPRPRRRLGAARRAGRDGGAARRPRRRSASSTPSFQPPDRAAARPRSTTASRR